MRAGSPEAIASAVRLFEEGDLAGAESICREILRERKKDFEALRLRGAVALRRGEAHEALRDFEKCLSLRPGDPQLHFLAGKAEAAEGRYDRALRRFDEALHLRPGDPKTTEWKALVLEWSGAHRRAREALRPFVEAGSETAAMAEVQAKVELHEGRPAEAAAILERHLARRDLAPPDRHRLGHVLGRARERLNDFDAAFRAHTEAGRAVARPFDPAAYVRAIDALIETFPAASFARLARHPRPDERHVFIAGMPRSGTTLVEQILDAHPEACGVGEHPGIAEIALRLPQETRGPAGWPACVAGLTRDGVVRLAQRYRSRLPAPARSARRAVNKHLENWLHLGLIALLFPEARVVHVRRDPLDVGLSCFTSDILPAAHPWITDLGHIGLVSRQCARLMDHWKRELDLPILQVGYEELVEDLEGVVEQLLEFCGLGWDERCLRYWESGRAVRTLSYDQVRQPVYRSSIGRSASYRAHLGPLIEALRETPG